MYTDNKIKLNTKKIRRLVVIAAVVLVALIVALSSFTVIPAGHRGVLLTMGAVSDRTLNEGLNFKIPFVQSVRTIDVRMQKVESAQNSSASKDLQSITSTIAVNYRVASDSVAPLYKNIGIGFESTIISPAISETIKAVTSRFTAEELITKRTDVSLAMKELLQQKLQDKFIQVDSFNVINFEFSEAFNKAIEEKQIAEQNALKSKYDLERVKTEAQQAVEKARGEAEAMKAKNVEITDKIIAIEFINKWDGKMPTYFGGDNLMFSIPGLDTAVKSTTPVN